VLVGRHAGVSSVVLLPRTKGDPPSEVVPLSDAEYAVAAATDGRQVCGRPAAGP
jgi:hypothetical protein